MNFPPIPPNEHPWDSRVVNVIAGTLVPLVLGSIFAIARIYTRATIIKCWGPEDTFITIAWILSVVVATLNCLITRFGEGHHTFTITIHDAQTLGKIALPATLLYQLTLFLTKMGICLFYLRIFEDRRSRILMYSLMVFLVSEIIAAELMIILRCRPFMEFFNLASTKCSSSLPAVYVNAVSNILADILLLVFVVPQILPLQMPRRLEIPLLAIVSLGVLVVIAASIRLYRTLEQTGARDFTYTAVDIPIWSSIEVSTGIFCASAPCTRPLFRKIAPKFLSSIFRPQPSNLPTSGRIPTFGSPPGRKARSNGIELQSGDPSVDGNYEMKGKPQHVNYSCDLSDYDNQLDVLKNSHVSMAEMVNVKTPDGEKSDAGDEERSQHQAVQFEHI